MSRPGMPLLPSWFFGSVSGDDPKTLAADLNARLRELELLIEPMRLAMLYGPIAGSYVPFFFSRDQAAGIAVGIQGACTVPFDFKPLFFDAWVSNSASTLTVNVRYDTGAVSDVLASNLQFTGSGFVNSRAAFAVDRIPAESLLSLDVVSVGDGATPVPVNIRGALWGKGASRIEDT